MDFDLFHFFTQKLYTIILNILIMLFTEKMFTPKYRNKMLYVCITAVWTAIMFWINSYGIPMLNTASYFIFQEIICLTLFNTGVVKSLAYNLLVIMFTIAADTLTYTMWSVILGLNFDEIGCNPKLLTVSNIFNTFLTFLGYKIISSILLKNEWQKIKRTEALFLTVITVGEIYILNYMITSIEDKRDGVIAVISIILFFFANIFISYTFQKMSRMYQYKCEIDVLRRQNSIQLEHYKEMEHTYTQTRQLIHDFKKHISVINDMNNTDYKHQLEKRIDSLFGNYRCSNSILGIITGRKLETAEKAGISVTVDMEDLTLDFIDELDITGIFANLWDNAIEACAELSGEKSVRFEMRKVNGFILITVCNTYNSSKYQQMKSNGHLSSKSGHMGAGLRIIKELTDKYNALLNVSSDEKFFTVEITLPVPE